MDYNYTILLQQDMLGLDVIYTNPSNKSSVKFCVDEVFEDRGGIDIRRIRRGKG